MTRSLPLAMATAILLLGVRAVSAQDVPTYEYNGLPLTPHQLQVLAADRVREQPPAPPLAQDGMPASPHQLAVLRPSDHPTH